MKIYNGIFFIVFLVLYKPGCCYEENDLIVSSKIENSLQNVNNILTVKIHNLNKSEHLKLTKAPRKITPLMFRILLENETYCSSLNDFPNFFTDAQRENGAFIVAVLVGIYCFTLLALICDNYFLPCVERICEYLHLSQDVAAATFMAMATSAPELFVNIVGTFITESDIGLGTVVGSSLFNTLGVAALGSMTAKFPIKVDWWPVTRDCILYLISISALVLMTWDGLIFWYEGLTLFIIYFLYFTIMFNNQRISKVFRKLAGKRSRNSDELDESSSTSTNLSLQPPIFIIDDDLKHVSNVVKSEYNLNDESLKYYSEITESSKYNLNEVTTTIDFEYQTVEDNPQKTKNLCTMPKGHWFRKVLFIYTWPLKVILFVMIPDPKTKPKWFPITFLLCVVFIGVNSYIISWMITVIGHTFGISESVLGLTFLAAGSCLPEAVSIIIMSRKGEGSMGISNALGANTMNILLSLGLPWFIKTMMGIQNSSGAFIEITSGSMEYTILSLVIVIIVLFVTMYFNNFELAKRTGIILIIAYIIFLTLAVLSETFLLQTEPC